MALASVVGLLVPAFEEGEPAAAGGGLAAGVAFLLLTRRALAGRDVHVGRLHGAGVRRSLLVFIVLLVHSLPEGFAIGTAYASDRAGLGVFVILAIALQNVPEGTSVAIPMREAGFTAAQQFWAAVADQRSPAGGRRHRVRAGRARRRAAAGLLRLRRRRDARPGGRRAASPGLHAPSTWRSALAGFAAGAALMLALSSLLGV